MADAVLLRPKSNNLWHETQRGKKHLINRQNPDNRFCHGLRSPTRRLLGVAVHLVAPGGVARRKVFVKSCREFCLSAIFFLRLWCCRLRVLVLCMLLCCCHRVQDAKFRQFRLVHDIASSGRCLPPRLASTAYVTCDGQHPCHVVLLCPWLVRVLVGGLGSG